MAGPIIEVDKGRIFVSIAGSLQISVALPPRHSRNFGAIVRAIILVYAQSTGAFTAREVMQALAPLSLPQRTIYYYLQKLTKEGFLEHAYGGYRYVTGGEYAVKALLMFADGKFANRADTGGASRGRGGGGRDPHPVCGGVILFGFEGWEHGGRFPDALVRCVAGRAGFRLNKVRRVIIYRKGQVWHGDVAVGSAEFGAVENGYLGGLVAGYVAAFIVSGLGLMALVGPRVLERLWRAVKGARVEWAWVGNLATAGPPLDMFL